MIELFLAIAIVESNLDPTAVGDQGSSVGIVQISVPVIQDVNCFYDGCTYKPEDRTNIDKSYEIFVKYINYWGSVYERKTGKELTNEVRSRIWNGGAYGWKAAEGTNKKKNLDVYWSKVRHHLTKGSK
tara:strand:+ start:3565 stop:3948 length:384 start_codon:yes stop_codon:yes gene_type:complete